MEGIELTIEEMSGLHNLKDIGGIEWEFRGGIFTLVVPQLVVHIRNHDLQHIAVDVFKSHRGDALARLGPLARSRKHSANGIGYHRCLAGQDELSAIRTDQFDILGFDAVGFLIVRVGERTSFNLRRLNHHF